MNIYVGNLPFSTTQDELRSVFAAFGEVTAARIVNDRETGRPKGFGFVDMPNADEAKNAIEASMATISADARRSSTRPVPGSRGSNFCFNGNRKTRST